MIIIGIDPGASGGIAAIGTTTGEVALHKMPDNESDINQLIVELSGGDGAVAYIERLQPMPKSKRGAVSSFKLGAHYGFLRGTLFARVRFDEVRPRDWQKFLGIYHGKNDTDTQKKNRNKSKAQQLFPQLRVTNATADALLIAEYGRRKEQGQ